MSTEGHGSWCHCLLCAETANLRAEIERLKSDLTASMLEIDRLQGLLSVATDRLTALIVASS
jgi:hypothetical protein